MKFIGLPGENIHWLDKIQLEGFDSWFYDMMHASESALMRDVLRNQKKNLKEEWLKVRPMIEPTKESE